MEVDGNYESVGYYREAFGRDQIRVNQIFQQLQQLDAPTFCTPRLSLQCVLNLVCNDNCLAICLVDNFILHYKGKIIKDGQDRYMGHYAILCGISTKKEHIAAADELEGLSGIEEDYCIVLCNPAKHYPATMYITPSRFESCWRSAGTDDDIIFLFRGQDETFSKELRKQLY